MKNRSLFLYVSIGALLSFNMLGGQAQVGSDPGNVINVVAWNSDGTSLAAGRPDGMVQIVNVSAKSLTSFDLGHGSIGSIFWNPAQSNQLAVATRHSGLDILEIDDDQLHTIRESFKTDQEIAERVAWSPDGNRLATIETRGSGVGGTSKIMVWNPETGDLLISFENGSSFHDIAWNPQKPNEMLVTGIVEDFDQYPIEIFVWDVETDQIVWQIEEPNTGITYIAWNAEGTQFAALTTVFTDDGSGVARAQIYSGENGEQLRFIPIDQNFLPSKIVWTPGNYLAIQGDNAIDVWNTENTEFVTRIEGSNFISAFAWSPDGSTLAYGQTDGKVEFITPSPLSQFTR